MWINSVLDKFLWRIVSWIGKNQQQMIKGKTDEPANVIKDVEHICKNFSYVRILKESIPEGMKKIGGFLA